MEIIVFWAADGERHGAVEYFNSPYIADEWSKYCINFNEITNEQEAKEHICVFATTVEDMAAEKKNKEYALVFAKTDTCSSFAGYVEWLEKNIDFIQVDGLTFWESKHLSK